MSTDKKTEVAQPQEKKERPKRVPVSGARDILTVPNMDPNYVYRWVYENPNRPGRVARLELAGYEVVQQEIRAGHNTVDRGSQVGSTVTRVDGSGHLILMRILKEWFDEDQAAEQDRIDELEATIKNDVREGRIPGTGEKGYGKTETFRRS